MGPVATLSLTAPAPTIAHCMRCHKHCPNRHTPYTPDWAQLGGPRGGPRGARGGQKKCKFLSRLGELLNTQKNVHILAPPGGPPGGPQNVHPKTPHLIEKVFISGAPKPPFLGVPGGPPGGPPAGGARGGPGGPRPGNFSPRGPPRGGPPGTPFLGGPGGVPDRPLDRPLDRGPR